MYELRVFYRDDPIIRDRITLTHAANVVARLPELLGKHGECDRIEVMLGPTCLFAVDCKGNRIRP